MASLLHIETFIWIAMVLAALMAMLALGSAARKATRPTLEMPNQPAPMIERRHAQEGDERTMARWSRVVQQSNTAFWTYVSNRSEHRR